MGRSLSTNLRERMVRGVQSGKTRRAVAEQYEVTPSTAIRLQKRFEETGSVAPAKQGRPAGGGKLAPFRDAIIAKVEATPDITMPTLAEWLLREHGVTVDPSNISEMLCKAGYNYKKTLLASEQERPDVKKARHEWRVYRQPLMRQQRAWLVFIDETSVKTNMTPLRGRSLKGQRLRADTPFGKWHTQTFIAGLRCDELIAPWVVSGAMNRDKFDVYVETQLAPTLQAGDVVILDNLSVHNSPRAKAALRQRGAWLLFLPAYSPDLNPIEMAFSKLKTLLRQAKARTYDDLWRALGHVCDLFKPNECSNFFEQAGYGAY